MTRHSFSAFLGSLLLMFPIPLSWGEVAPDDVVSFDAQNYLVYRLVADNGISISLMIWRDGSVETWELDQDSFYVGTSIEEIRYWTRDKLWIVSRVGHRLNAASLLDLSNRSLLKVFPGQEFSISADGAHVAWTRREWDLSKTHPHLSMYIDEMMVIPDVAILDLADKIGDRTSDGRSVASITKESSGWVYEHIIWSAKDQVEFLYCSQWDYDGNVPLAPFEHLKASTLFRFEDNEALPDSGTVQIVRTPISATTREAAIAYFQSAIR